MNDRVKEDLVEWISKPQNEDLLESLKLMKEAASSEDWYEGLTEEDKKSIKKGLKDHEEGRVLSSKEFWKKYPNMRKAVITKQQSVIYKVLNQQFK